MPAHSSIWRSWVCYHCRTRRTQTMYMYLCVSLHDDQCVSWDDNVSLRSLLQPNRTLTVPVRTAGQARLIV